MIIKFYEYYLDVQSYEPVILTSNLHMYIIQQLVYFLFCSQIVNIWKKSRNTKLCNCHSLLVNVDASLNIGKDVFIYHAHG